MEAILLALAPVAIKLLIDLGASAANEAMRRNKEAGKASPSSLVWLAFVLNFGSANVDKVAQLARSGGAPDGRAPRVPTAIGIKPAP